MTANKSEPTKKTTSRRKPAARKETLNETITHVEENARHIQENRYDIQNNTKMIHILYSIIILLLLIVAGLAFWLWNNFSWKSQEVVQPDMTWKEVVITILHDKRCTDCITDDILSQLQQMPYLSEAQFITKDFSDTWVEELLRENNLSTLPQVIFNTNNLWDWWMLSSWLQRLNNGDFFLDLSDAPSFDPFVTRSERGFLIVEQDIINNIIGSSYSNWDANTPLVWLEYSDFGCAFCVRMHAEENTVNNVLAAFPDTIHARFQHMAFRNREVPEAIECIAEQAWESAFNILISEWFNNGASTKSDVLNIASAQNISFNSNEYEACIADGRMQRKIETHMQVGQNVFWVSGTPGNVIVNIETWEYEIISWAFPQATFEEVIRRLQ